MATKTKGGSNVAVNIDCEIEVLESFPITPEKVRSKSNMSRGRKIAGKKRPHMAKGPSGSTKRLKEDNSVNNNLRIPLGTKRGPAVKNTDDKLGPAVKNTGDKQHRIEKNAGLVTKEVPDVMNRGKKQGKTTEETIVKSVTKLEDLHALIMEDPDSLWEFEVVSRLDFDPGNHGKRKCTITRDELKRRISPPENLGHSVHAILAFLRVAKNKTTVNLVRDIVDKLGCVDEKAAIVRSAFTLMPEEDNDHILKDLERLGKKYLPGKRVDVGLDVNSYLMNLVDFLDIHGEEFNTVTHGGVGLLKQAIKIFRHVTNNI